MKVFSGFAVSLLVLGGLGGLPTISPASEARLSATGGLTTLLTDETSDLNLFLGGNPAGLVLLNSRSRVDLTGQWAYSNQTGPWGSGHTQSLNVLTGSTGDHVGYGGLMLFPDPQWALQLTGDAVSTQGVPAYLDDTYTFTQIRGGFRAAYALPSLTCGVELITESFDKKFDPGQFDTGIRLNSGSSGQSLTRLKTGFAFVPGRPFPDEARWQAGGFITFPLGSPVETLNLTLEDSAPFPVTRTLSIKNHYSLGAQILYEVPSIAKINLTAGFTSETAAYQQSVSFLNNAVQTSQGDFQTLNLVGSFRWTLPFTETENIHWGGSLNTTFNNRPQSLSTTSQWSGANSSLWQRELHVGGQMGIGLDNPKEYTFGIQ